MFAGSKGMQAPSAVRITQLGSVLPKGISNSLYIYSSELKVNLPVVPFVTASRTAEPGDAEDKINFKYAPFSEASTAFNELTDVSNAVLSVAIKLEYEIDGADLIATGYIMVNMAFVVLGSIPDAIPAYDTPPKKV